MVLTGPVIRRRLALCMAVFILLLTVLGGRLFWLQVIGGRALQQRAQSQWTSESVVKPARGAILDRNGAVLAQSATAYTASASPRQVVDPARFATLLSPVLDMEAAVILSKVSDTSRGGVTLKRQLPRETAQQLKRMKAIMIRQNSILMAKLMKPEMLVDIQMNRYGIFDFDKSEKIIAVGQKKTAQTITRFESSEPKSSWLRFVPFKR